MPRRAHCRTARRHAATHLPGGQDRYVLAGHVRLPPGTLAATRYRVGRCDERRCSRASSRRSARRSACERDRSARSIMGHSARPLVFVAVARPACVPAPTMMQEPSTPRSLLTSVATLCSAAAGGSPAHSTSTIRSMGTRVGRSTASSFSKVRDLRLPTLHSGSSVPPRMTPKVPARRNSICKEPAVAMETSFATSTSYRWSAASASRGSGRWTGRRRFRAPSRPPSTGQITAACAARAGMVTVLPPGGVPAITTGCRAAGALSGW